jgi:hypothetical protein
MQLGLRRNSLVVQDGQDDRWIMELSGSEDLVSLKRERKHILFLPREAVRSGSIGSGLGFFSSWIQP